MLNCLNLILANVKHMSLKTYNGTLWYHDSALSKKISEKGYKPSTQIIIDKNRFSELTGLSFIYVKSKIPSLYNNNTKKLIIESDEAKEKITADLGGYSYNFDDYKIFSFMIGSDDFESLEDGDEFVSSSQIIIRFAPKDWIVEKNTLMHSSLEIDYIDETSFQNIIWLPSVRKKDGSVYASDEKLSNEIKITIELS